MPGSKTGLLRRKCGLSSGVAQRAGLNRRFLKSGKTISSVLEMLDTEYGIFFDINYASESGIYEAYGNAIYQECAEELAKFIIRK